MATIHVKDGELFVKLVDMEDLIDSVKCVAFRKGFNEGREVQRKELLSQAQAFAAQQADQCRTSVLGTIATERGLIGSQTNQTQGSVNRQAEGLVSCREPYEGIVGGQRAIRDSDHVPFHDPYRGRDSIG